ncbi:hypothetical protein GU926_11475 [Nibribacter ruber]|uniref:Uncharacterized protein n=1 Tax=Nibribacter ruber TaxID=2698458 RepID=A0A6P1P0C7_9BACT|nr:hypothetical protein [Nibribacter ruber]QHL88015.1 hypothetical protein GU926_11475 [Nibribacter ruber]
MFIALVILLIIALFITVYYYKANRGGAANTAGTATRVSGGNATSPTVPGQASGGTYNPGSVPDGTGQDKGSGNAAMSSGMQG